MTAPEEAVNIISSVIYDESGRMVDLGDARTIATKATSVLESSGYTISDPWAVVPLTATLPTPQEKQKMDPADKATLIGVIVIGTLIAFVITAFAYFAQTDDGPSAKRDAAVETARIEACRNIEDDALRMLCVNGIR